MRPKSQTVCNPMDCSPPSSSVHGISQARILEWAAISLSRGSLSPALTGRFFFFTTSTTWEASYEMPPDLLRGETSQYLQFSMSIKNFLKLIHMYISKIKSSKNVTSC